MRAPIVFRRLLWVACLAIIGLWSAFAYFSESPSGQAACAADPYVVGTVYQQGDQVQNVDRQFECWKDEDGPPLGPDSWKWCQQVGYAPGDSVHWRDAWRDLGECGGFEGNRLSLSFATLSGKAPLKEAVIGVARADQVVTGVLRCKTQEIPISAKANETLDIDGLKACDYQLVMNVADGFAPLNTPRIVSFKADEGDQQTLTVKYRPPVDIGKLSGLPGIKIELFAQGLLQPRQMAMGKHVLYVGSSAIPSYVYDGKIADMIYALPLDGAGKPTGIHVIASGLEEPHGVAYRDGDLYYSTTGGLYRLRDADENYKDPKPERVLSFPADDRIFPLPPLASGSSTRIWHMKHPLHFNPFDPADQGLYTAVGIPCNLCMIPADGRYGTLLRYDLETGKAQVLARGIRNTVGFDWNPRTREIWFSDNNRQGFPNPDEVNRVSGPGLHFGVPYRFGKGQPGFTQEEFENPGVIQPPLVPGAIVSDKSLEQINPQDYVPAAFELGTNTAPLGIKFWDGYPTQGDTQRVLVAAHGTGSTESPGTDVQMLTIQGGTRVVNQIPLINHSEQALDQNDVYALNGSTGRPTDFLELADKSLLISDDVAGMIYRVHYDASAVLDTQLALRPMLAPAPELSDEMISGYLISPGGNSRLFHVSWSPSDSEAGLVLKGLGYGDYQLKLNDVKNWIPQVRTTHFTLSAANKTKTINLQYRERPIKLEVKVTIPAPQKPASVTDDQWHITIRDKADPAAQPRTVNVPWGESVTQTLNYGQYEILYPFYAKEKPQPELVNVVIDESSEDMQVLPMAYRKVEELGPVVLAESCTKCHTVEYYNRLSLALRYSVAGQDALVKTIKTMAVAGHCDTTCASEISKHLYNVVWAPYLNPAESYGERQLRLLTPAEYAASVKDILNVEINPEKLPADKSEKDFKYPGEADKGILQTEDVKLFYDMALFVADKVAPERLTSLKLARQPDLVTALGYRLFRRPLSDAEHARYKSLLDTDGQTGLVAGMLLSPHFLYRSELGQTVEGRSTVFKLTPFELATALSFAFEGTTPNIELLDKAEKGLLNTPQQIGTEVERMMRSDRGVEQFNRFVSYYTKTNRGVQAKPGLSTEMIQFMAREQFLLTRNVLLSEKGTLDELFNPGYTYLNAALAAHYGISGVSGDTLQKVPVDEKRGGLLHLGRTQAANSDYRATSLVKRGIMIREQMFCREFGAPVEADPVEPDYPARAITTREHWDLVNGEQASGGRCWQCHQYMNDTGSSMEHYDAAGRYRLEESAYNYAQYPQVLPIKASGPFLWTGGKEDINDVRDIAKLIPRNPASLFCMADSYFRFAFGNKSDEATSGTVKAIADGLQTSGSLREMLRALGTSNAFLYKTERE